MFSIPGKAKLKAKGKEKSRELYQSIQAHQTRLICLHGHKDDLTRPVACSLYVADILHEKFRALQIRPPSAKPTIVSFAALSYCWGRGAADSTLKCNGISIKITRHLMQGLHDLRQVADRFLWIDAISINQADDIEKGVHIANMFAIYRTATSVIAWLGPGDDCFLPFDKSGSAESLTFRELSCGLEKLYSNPYFGRLWVQQEIFAAQRLDVYCGRIHLRHIARMIDPEDVKKYCLSLLGFNMAKIGHEDVAQLLDDAQQREGILALVSACRNKLNCFRIHSTSDSESFDLILTLMRTSSLEASDPRDFIYGVLGISKFPSRVTKIKDWLKLRHHQLFIPIDYSADIDAILSAVTWVMLMIKGLILLESHHVIDSASTATRSLPSWAIDWRLASRYREAHEEQESIIAAFESYFKNPLYETNPKSKGRLRKLEIVRDRSDGPSSSQATSPYRRLEPDNLASSLPITTLLVYGFVSHQFFASGQKVYAKPTGEWTPLTACWDVQVPLEVHDKVVYISGICNIRLTSEEEGSRPDGRLWILRPCGNEEHTLVCGLAYDQQARVQQSPWVPRADQSGGRLVPFAQAARGRSKDGYDPALYQAYHPPISEIHVRERAFRIV